MFSTRIVTLLLIAMTGAAAVAGAQATCTATGTASPANSCTVVASAQMTLVNAARIVLTNSATTLTAPSVADFVSGNGLLTSGAGTLTAKSNAAYSITATASTSTFLNALGAATSKLASDVRVVVNGTPATNGLSSTLGSPIATNEAATPIQDYLLGYSTVYRWSTDRPGTYKLVVNYTLTAP